MAYDQNTRNRLQRFVSEARNLLSGEFARQFQQKYGLDASSGEVSELERLVHLNDREMETAQMLRDTLAHYLASSPSGGKRECLERMIREQAFTVLNRLCALRMAEAREIIIESLSRIYNSKGFQLYARLASTALGETGDAYRAYIFSLFDELALDLPVLFDRFSPQGYLFPGEGVLLELLGLMNDSDLSALWVEDETIGWIYQYFNSLDERRQMRSESQAPRNSRELAVRNQFFTPRYVVEFLTDNTLGRLWYEMTRGETQLKDSCNYLVRRPQEIFLAAGEEAPETEAPTDDLSQEDMLQQAVYIPYRPLKDPREILMLDPACGSMHFGLYAFDLYEKIYEEAWDLESQLGFQAFGRSDNLQPLQQTYASREEFLRDVPRLIVEGNIHGVDIDSRAVQIAGLSLWLRAQRSWLCQGVKPQQRPQIRKSNVVCAEPMPGEKGMLEEFAGKLKPRVLGQLVEMIFDKMQLAGEAGSLLKIEEEIEEALNLAREEFQNEIKIRNEERSTLFSDIIPPRQASLFDFTDLGDKTRFWTYAEERLLDALREYAEQADGTDAVQKRLFAQDAAIGFAFIDLFRKRYDVVLMNPPFGDTATRAKSYCDKKYVRSKNDLATMFIDRFTERLSLGGKLGQLTTRTWLFLRKYSGLRMHLLNKYSISTMADLGYGVLDALVEAAAVVFGADYEWEKSCFISVLHSNDKLNMLTETSNHTWLNSNLFLRVKNNIFAYWIPESLLKNYISIDKCDSDVCLCCQGIATSDDFRFFRLSWETPFSEATGTNNKWVPVAKGGEYRPYYDDIYLKVKWFNEGAEVKSFVVGKYSYLKGDWGWVVKNSEQYFKKGLTWSYRTTSAFCMKVLPQDCIFSVGGWGLFPENMKQQWAFLALYNSTVGRYFMEVPLGRGDTSESGTAARNYGEESIYAVPKLLPNDNEVEVYVRKMIDFQRVNDSLDETSHCFVSPVLSFKSSLNNSIKNIFVHYIDSVVQRLNDSLYLENKVRSLMSLTAQDENAILEQEGEHPCSYMETCSFDNDLQKLYEGSESDLIAAAKAERGGLRFISKKAYYVDRRLELLCHIKQTNPRGIVDLIKGNGWLPQGYMKNKVECILSYLWSIPFGRWDIRYAIGQNESPEFNDPFVRLPVCPPGMLQNEQGLPASPQDIPDDYPLRISWRGILVDNEGHPEDIVARVREAIEVIWEEKAGDIEQEACEILAIDSLRDYFRKPGNFFAEHLKRYSKSRRQAPIYWPLSTASGSYTIWLYYQRLSDQTLYRCVNDYIEPKLKQVTDSTRQLRQKSGRSRQEERELEELVNLDQELQEFRDELLRVAAFWKPDLNDGVQITAAPLWKLFRLPKWRTTLKETWEKLEKGDYDWAHLAYSIWPERVKEKCKHDKSLAIAHDLEDIYEEPVAQAKKKGGRGKKNT